MSMPHISVVTSCYNSVRYLKEAIESILNQTFTDFEFILINDGSSDHTLDIMREYAAKDTRIVVLDKANTGLTDSLNIGISKARGKWIARMDDDDIAMPERFEAQVNVVSGSNDIILLGSGCITIDEKGRELNRYTYPSEHKSFLMNIERGHSTFPHASAMFRLDVVNKLNGYRRRMNGSEDLDLWLRMSAHGRITCISKPLLKLRKHSESITSNNERLMILSAACVISHLIRIKGLPDPVDGSEDLFHDYLTFIEKRLVDQKAFDVQRLLFDLRNLCNSAASYMKLMRTVLFFIRSQNKYSVIRNKFLKRRYYKSIAQEWTERVSA